MISTDLSPEASAHVVVDIPYHPVLPDFNQERVEIGVHHKLRKLCSEESPRRDMSQIVYVEGSSSSERLG
jgi:predicted secreted protein